MVISIEGLYWVFWIYRAKQGKKTKTKAVGAVVPIGTDCYLPGLLPIGEEACGGEGGGLTTGFIGQPVIGL